jgi:hypothetical protein
MEKEKASTKIQVDFSSNIPMIKILDTKQNTTLFQIHLPAQELISMQTN